MPVVLPLFVVIVARLPLVTPVVLLLATIEVALGSVNCLDPVATNTVVVDALFGANADDVVVVDAGDEYDSETEEGTREELLLLKLVALI